MKALFLFLLFARAGLAGVMSPVRAILDNKKTPVTTSAQPQIICAKVPSSIVSTLGMVATRPVAAKFACFCESSMVACFGLGMSCS